MTDARSSSEKSASDRTETRSANRKRCARWEKPGPLSTTSVRVSVRVYAMCVCCHDPVMSPVTANPALSGTNAVGRTGACSTEPASELRRVQVLSPHTENQTEVTVPARKTQELTERHPKVEPVLRHVRNGLPRGVTRRPGRAARWCHGRTHVQPQTRAATGRHWTDMCAATDMSGRRSWSFHGRALCLPPEPQHAPRPHSGHRGARQPCLRPAGFLEGHGQHARSSQSSVAI